MGDSMRILILDDEQQFVDDLQFHIQRYMETHLIKTEITATVSAKDILESEAAFDLAFLDIQMPEADGISVAKELKKRNSRVILFFVTAFEEYQDEAMDLHIFRYFEKPFDEKRLYASLDKAMEYLDDTYVDLFLTRAGESNRIVVDDIVFIRRENRRIILQTIDGNEYQSTLSLEEWMTKLPNTFFYLVHKGFLVNLHYITKCTYTELYLNKSIRVPIAPRKQAAFHKYWFEYLKRR